MSNVTFEVAAAKTFPGTDYDFICIFDAIHDMGDPAGAAAHIRQALKQDGSFMVVQPLAGDALEENLHLLGTIFYGFSTLACVPASKAQEVGFALGAQAGQKRLSEVLMQGGFNSDPPRRADRHQHGAGGAGLGDHIPSGAGLPSSIPPGVGPSSSSSWSFGFGLSASSSSRGGAATRAHRARRRRRRDPGPGGGAGARRQARPGHAPAPAAPRAAPRRAAAGSDRRRRCPADRHPDWRRAGRRARSASSAPANRACRRPGNGRCRRSSPRAAAAVRRGAIRPSQCGGSRSWAGGSRSGLFSSKPGTARRWPSASRGGWPSLFSCTSSVTVVSQRRAIE